MTDYSAIPMVATSLVAFLFVAFYAKAYWERDRTPCLCHHRFDRHVRFRDYDSDAFDPQHVGPDYRKPGTCRDCRCRSFIQEIPR